METNYVQQEILLMTGTSFASGNLCPKDESHPGKALSENEKLEEACWNGLLQAMLPEICVQATNGGMLYLWQVKQSESFLELDLGEAPAAFDRRLSIVPYSFLATRSYN